ncbi:MAG: PAS domain-containing sensor histidine kinase [bacterium]|nr:PAS domain-containing sensor histidine kinase [bacterium]
MVEDTSNNKGVKIQVLLEDIGLLERYIQELSTFFPLPLCFVSPIGVILEVNPALEEIFGYKFHELIGEPLEKIFSKEQANALLAETMKQGGVKNWEMPIRSKLGKEMIVGVYTQSRTDEARNFLGLFLGLFDLTDLKKANITSQKITQTLQEERQDLKNAQKALMNMLEDTDEERERAEEERNTTQLIIQNFSDGLLLVGETGRVELMNPEAETLLGIMGQDGVGKELSFVFPQLTNLSDMKGSLFRVEVKLQDPRVVEVTTISMQARGDAQGMLVVLHDITREKQIEQMKTEFVSLAAHQLRTPLSAIKWTINMMLNKDLGPITDDQENFLGKMYNSNERMISLINDLLDITRIEEGRYLYRPEFEHVEGVLKETVRSYEEEASRKNISLKLKLPSRALPRALVDKEKMSLVFQNLVENALHYTPKGGQVNVSISLHKDGESIEILVKDTGMGIPKEQQGHIFEKFFRVDAATKVNTEGSGLGLYLVKNIVGAHKGKVWFESEIGKGTAFHVVLPIKEEGKEFLKGL